MLKLLDRVHRGGLNEDLSDPERVLLAQLRAGTVRFARTRGGSILPVTVHPPRVERKPLHRRDGGRERVSLVEERHGEFVAALGDRLMARYSDGGPSDRPRARNRARNRAARAARRRNRS